MHWVNYFFSEARKSTNSKVVWWRCPIKCVLQNKYVNSNITENDTFQKEKNYEETKQKKRSNP